MKTSLRQNKVSGTFWLAVVSLVAVALVGSDLLFGGAIRSVVRDAASGVLRGAQAASSSLAGSGLFVSHRSLAEENIALRQSLAALQTLQEENALLLEENASLRVLTSVVQSERATVSAPVLSQTDSSLYGTFLLGAGSAQGVLRGAQVQVAGHIILGVVSDVSQNTALVRSLLAPGASTSGFVGSSTSITVMGQGGGSGIARVPRDTEVVVGDPVYYTDLQSIMGIVGAVESSPENAEKTVHLRVPQNTLGIRYVTILPPL